MCIRDRPILFRGPKTETAKTKINAFIISGERVWWREVLGVRDEGEWISKVEIRRKKKFLGVGDAYMVVF